MYQKTILLIGVLALVAAVLFYLAINRNTATMNKNTGQNNPTTSGGQQMQETAAKTADLYFTPSTTNSLTGTADIMLNTGGKEVSGVQIELSFDPQLVTALTIEPATDSLFGEASTYTVLIKSVDLKLGRATLAVGISAGTQGVGGTGKVATINYTATGPASISMLDKSAVTQLNVATSVLSTVSSLTINPQ